MNVAEAPNATAFEIMDKYVRVDGVRYTFEEAVELWPWIAHYLPK